MVRCRQSRPMTAELVKRAATESWRACFLGLAIMLAASLLWSVVCVLVLLGVDILHIKDVTKAVLMLSFTVVPCSVLVGGILGYWIASAQPSPIGAASLACVAAVAINALFLSFVTTQSSNVPHGWVNATLGGAVLGLTAAPFWFAGALVLYGFVEKRLLSGTLRSSSRTGVLSALIEFCLNPSSSVLKVTNPSSWGCYLLGYNLLFSLLLTFLLTVPTRKYLGASYVAQPSRFWIWVVFVSVIEELTFRLPLRHSGINLTISALLFAFSVVDLLLKFSSFGLVTTKERLLWGAIFAILVASVVFVLLLIEPVKRLTRNIWVDHFRSVVYASCFAFGLVHLFNYRFTSLTAATLLLAPLLVLPQIISGFVFAFARMRLGLIWCIVLHAAHNLVLLLILGQLRPVRDE
jgi:hypothetical protein